VTGAGRLGKSLPFKTIAALCVLSGVARASEPPALSLTDLSGNPQTLEQYRGRVVVLNFWATWCIPCREEMPLLMDIQKRYASKGVVVVGASADDESTQTQITPFVRKLRITFPVWRGATTQHMERLGLGRSLPATAVIGPDGQIAFRILGVIERKAIRERLDWLVEGGQGPAPDPLIDGITAAKNAHGHGKEEHTHGAVGMEGASTVPS
jgi:thiol-disulfide isomerase/thioredoxin